MPVFYEEFEVGSTYTTPGRTITEADIGLFSGLTGDHASIHTDARYAASTEFGQRVAHGLLGLCIAQGLTWRVSSPGSARLASLGWNDYRFVAPIFIGDTIYVKVTVTDKRKSRSDPTKGIVTEKLEILNQSDELVQQGFHVTAVRVGDS